MLVLGTSSYGHRSEMVLLWHSTAWAMTLFGLQEDPGSTESSYSMLILKRKRREREKMYTEPEQQEITYQQ